MSLDEYNGPKLLAMNSPSLSIRLVSSLLSTTETPTQKQTLQTLAQLCTNHSTLTTTTKLNRNKIMCGLILAFSKYTSTNPPRFEGKDEYVHQVVIKYLDLLLFLLTFTESYPAAISNEGSVEEEEVQQESSVSLDLVSISRLLAPLHSHAIHSSCFEIIQKSKFILSLFE